MTAYAPGVPSKDGGVAWVMGDCSSTLAYIHGMTSAQYVLLSLLSNDVVATAHDWFPHPVAHMVGFHIL
jgi:hypothetical protein